MQSISFLMMVRPAHFGSNEQTAVNNFYQQNTTQNEAKSVALRALQEFDSAIQTLRDAQIPVLVLQDSDFPVKPDSIFPNNWISTHNDGTLVLYPMFAPNRRAERRTNITAELKAAGCKVDRVLDFTSLETEGHFLEGTGSLVLDHERRVAYASLSERTHPEALQHWSNAMGYSVISFVALQQVHSELKPVYHTNVVLSIGKHLALVADQMIAQADRQVVLQALASSGREILRLTEAQVNAFCGNALEVTDSHGHRRWVMSSAAWAAYTEAQKAALSVAQPPVVLHIPTIENVGGGSARCMLAEIFLPL